MRGGEGPWMEWSVFVGESTGLVGDGMWGVTDGRNKGGLLGPQFEKWGIYHDAHVPGWRRPEWGAGF